ncbi:hypothetical protein FEZ48_06270 [Marinilactibacillus psychrotolerans]|uniref:Uncharacterized protein n=1 Tax=Marinilactibacillus psychrotolerans TaxID=191770 RepID=A0A5R9C4A5_9LACT|nr:hypothetical protein [Marinilactibacillus psychrotolerans]TLQ07583.1 hypothetical protein FEZ48_06270 [Marinilactibacillus psychrotolerans]
MKKSAIDYLLRNYYMDVEERNIFNQLVKLKPNEMATVKNTPWINKMSVYYKGRSVKAFVLVDKNLYESTFMINRELVEEGAGE